MPDLPVFIAAQNPSWFDVPLDEKEASLVGEYHGWQGPALEKVKLQENRSITEWGIIPIPGKWRLAKGFLVVWIPETNGLYFSRLSRFGHFYGDVPLRRIRNIPSAPKKLEIVKAVYGGKDRWHDVASLLDSRIVGNRLNFGVNNLSTGFDPAPGIIKSLRVKYRLDEVEFDEEIKENSFFCVQKLEKSNCHLPVVRSSTMPNLRYRIVTFFMDNTMEVAKIQKKVFDKFGYRIDQVKTFMKHGIAIDDYLSGHGHEFDHLVLFDVDSIPLHEDAIPTTLSNIAMEDRIVGAAAQSNHISEDHPFAGMSCFGLPLRLWDDLGRPSFRSSDRSDTGEELTWASEEDGIGVALMWPGAIESPKWKLSKDRTVGLGTSFVSEDGIPLAYHAFECRFGYQRFVRKCEEIVSGKNSGEQR